MTATAWLSLLAEFAVFAVCLFGGAGTVHWPAGWIFLLLFFSGAAGITVSIARHDPALFVERMRSIRQPGQPLWDKIFLPVIGVLWLAWLVLMGADAMRGHWSVVPVWLQATGGLGVIAAFDLIYNTFRENTFLAPVVKIQAERGHAVIDTGPYATVRHPMYSGAVILMIATPLLLGSYRGLALSALMIAAVGWRAVMEERLLKPALYGYSAYMLKVRFRLIPHLW
jgi:protein-S-isoprenylcysteine O-methyltransferase Ste14